MTSCSDSDSRHVGIDGVVETEDVLVAVGTFEGTYGDWYDVLCVCVVCLR